jgi:hypothetical protein
MLGSLDQIERFEKKIDRWLPPMRNHGAADVAALWSHWTNRQNEAWAALVEHRYLLYGGARGGGKSRFMRQALVRWLIETWQITGLREIRVMLACETYPDLRDRQITKIKSEFPRWLGSLRDTKEDGLCFRLADEFGGGVIALRNLDDPSKYQSAEFAVIAIDELTKIQRETFDILRGSLRWPGINHTLFLGATNPGGRGHAWVKQLWIDRSFPVELRPRAHEFVFVQSLPADNPYLDKSYWDELNSLPEQLRKAWVDGDWTVFSGMAFPTWDETVHVIDPILLPAYWPRKRAVDWGYAAPFGCLWLCKDPNTGRIYIYREAYEAMLSDRQQANLIKELTDPDERILKTFADPSMWGRKSKRDENGKDVTTTSADEYLSCGIMLTQADNDRLGGKRKIDRLLMPLLDGLPGLQVFRDCKNFIRTVPYLAYDEHNIEDVDTKQEDHLYDCLRYGLTDEKTERPKNEQKKLSSNAWRRIKSI